LLLLLLLLPPLQHLLKPQPRLLLLLQLCQ
jgi:hypothetical protein